MTATRPLSDLRNDEKGAVMLTGLFMSCFLIGALWFLIGIGDTIVFRDKMQEAADHGAFAAAALHAKGMNFISLCNLVLLAAVTVHILLGLVHDIMLVACLIPPFLACGFWKNVRQIYTGYFNVLKPAAKAIHTAEVAASFSYPALGFAEGFQVGRSYGGARGSGPVTVLPISRTLVPGGSDWVGWKLERHKRKGLLPVSARPMSLFCEKIGKLGADAVLVHALGVSRTGVGGLVLKGIKALIGTALEVRYCNDTMGLTAGILQKKIEEKLKKAGGGDKEKDAGNEDDKWKKAAPSFDPGFDSFWGMDGPLVVMGRAENGNKFFQTKAVNLLPWMTDFSESRVGIARGPKRGMEKYEKSLRPIGYFAQSEFYFDCEKDWDDVSCNEDDNATFQIKWRARLRKLKLPKFVVKLIDSGGEGLPSPAQLKTLSSGPLGDQGAAGMQSLQPYLDMIPGLDADGFDSAPGAAP